MNFVTRLASSIIIVGIVAVALALVPGQTSAQPNPSGVSAQPGLPPTQVNSDRQVLYELYYATGGLSWSVNHLRREKRVAFSYWLGNEPINSWYGVAAAGGRVIKLGLGGIGMRGNIPPELGNLANLEHLGLTDNQLTGNIPPELGNLANLEHLGLTDNQLTGNIPPELGNFTNLTHLYLHNNSLSGNIPPELGNLTKLTHLNLTGNQLTGNIPPELGNLVNLTFLRLSNPGLSGCIPYSLRFLPNSDIPQISEFLPFCGDPPPPTPTTGQTPTPTMTGPVDNTALATGRTASPTLTSQPTPSIGEPTVNFHASQTEVPKGEPVALTLSVANSIINPEMTLQLVLQLPSGVSVRGEGLSESCSVQCSAIYKVPTGENRDFLLTAVPNQLGSFNIEGRMEWLFGDDPKTHAGKSASLMLTAVEPEVPPTLTPSNVGEPTVNLHATQTQVGIGEPVVLTLAADNSIAKPEMTLKFILQVPSGWSMSGAGFTEACSGQCTATYQVPSGEQKSIFLEMLPNQTGSFNAEALMEWYFGDDVSTLTRESKSLALNVVGPAANPTPIYIPTRIPVYNPPQPPGVADTEPEWYQYEWYVVAVSIFLLAAMFLVPIAVVIGIILLVRRILRRRRNRYRSLLIARP